MCPECRMCSPCTTRNSLITNLMADCLLLHYQQASTLSGAGSLRRGGSIVQSPSQLPPHMGGRSGSVHPRGQVRISQHGARHLTVSSPLLRAALCCVCLCQECNDTCMSSSIPSYGRSSGSWGYKDFVAVAQRAVSGRGRSDARGGGGRSAAGSSLAPPPAPSLAAAGVAAGGMPDDIAGTRLLHLSSIGEHEAEGATSSDLTSSADDAGSPPYRSRHATALRNWASAGSLASDNANN
jgi:hypothetical protein